MDHALVRLLPLVNRSKTSFFLDERRGPASTAEIAGSDQELGLTHGVRTRQDLVYPRLR